MREIGRRCSRCSRVSRQYSQTRSQAYKRRADGVGSAFVGGAREWHPNSPILYQHKLKDIAREKCCTVFIYLELCVTKCRRYIAFFWCRIQNTNATCSWWLSQSSQHTKKVRMTTSHLSYRNGLSEECVWSGTLDNKESHISVLQVNWPGDTASGTSTTCVIKLRTTELAFSEFQVLSDIFAHNNKE